MYRADEYRSCTQGLYNGGLAGLFWAYTWNFAGFGFIIVSLAEMASMYVSHIFHFIL